MRHGWAKPAPPTDGRWWLLFVYLAVLLTIALTVGFFFYSSVRT